MRTSQMPPPSSSQAPGPVDVPGPWSPPLLGARLQFAGDPLRRFLHLRDRYGGVVALGQLNQLPFFLVSDPAAIKHVLLDHSTRYKKGRATHAMAGVLGAGSLLLDGPTWLQRRRLVQPAFHRPRIAAHGQAFVEGGVALMDRWQRENRFQQPIDMRPEMLRLTMEMTVRNLFHADISGAVRELIDAWPTLYTHMSERRFSLFKLPEWATSAERSRFEKARDVVDRVVYHLIEERRKKPVDDGSILSMLIDARDAETGAVMTDKDLRDELMVMFVGGYETSSNALSFTLGLLAQHPDIAQIHRHELDDALQGRLPTVEDLSRLPFNRGVLEESMRMFPPSWVITREATQSDNILGFSIPVGAQILLSAYVVHHDHSVWPNPFAFRPERFAGVDPTTRPRFAYFPFGGGPRMCIGDQYALVEMQLLLATFAQRLQFKPAPGTKLEAQAQLGLRPKTPIRLWCEPRVKASA